MKTLITILSIFLILSAVSGQSADEHYESGMRLKNDGDFRSAIEEFTKAIELDSLYIEAWTARSDTWEDLGIFYEANEDLMKAYYLTGNQRFSEGNKADACRYWSMAAGLGHSDSKKIHKTNCRRKVPGDQ
jgi:tetratricopeptide (TPR) repeat protein